MDLNKFLQEQFTPRELTVDVPQLADWWEGEPKWTVRGLTAAELGRVRSAVALIIRDRTNALLAAAQTGEGVIDSAREIMEFYGREVPEETVRRIEMLVSGSVTPDIKGQRMVAVKLSEAYPMVFQALTDRIALLTDQGAEPGKRKASGGKAKSKA